MLIEKRIQGERLPVLTEKLKKGDFVLYITLFFKFFDRVHSMSSFLNHLKIKDTSEKLNRNECRFWT
jgi:hypothetical protein